MRDEQRYADALERYLADAPEGPERDTAQAWLAEWSERMGG